MGNISTPMPIVHLVFALGRMPQRLRYVRPLSGGFPSVCGCLSGDALTPTHSCTTTAQQPFHPDLRDDGACRRQPGLLPSSWRERPVPANLQTRASAPGIPDTDAPAGECPCLCGGKFSTKARLLLHVNGVHRPGTVHHEGLHMLPRLGGAYVAHDADAHEVAVAGMGRFPIQPGDAPSSTMGESRTILQALIAPRTQSGPRRSRGRRRGAAPPCGGPDVRCQRPKKLKNK